MATHRISFTKPKLAGIVSPKPMPGRQTVYDTYHDDKEAGLVLLVTSGGSKTFYLSKKINGRPERIKLGKFPDLSVENARKAAAQQKGQIAGGKNPNQERKRLRGDMSLGGLFHDYMERYSKKQKRSWRYDEREINKFLSHWFRRKLSDITKHEVQRLHEKIRDNNGLYQANRLLERLRAMYNKAIEWGWEGDNPASGVKKFKEKSRDRFVQTDELPHLFAAIDRDPNELIRDYVMLSLLTGARKGNVLAMRWDEINFERAEWRIPETKNGEPVILPLVIQAIEILERRRRATNSEWVLHSENSKSGHLADPKRAWKRIMEEAGIADLRIHDIRRTLGSYQAITGASMQIIGKSLGHKSQQATAVYARLNLDPVRQSVEKATAAMMAAGKA